MIQPYYMLEFTAISCLVEIRINDIPILTMNIKGQTSTNIPVNHALSESGEQQISCTLLPLYGETTLHPDASLAHNIIVYEVYTGFTLEEVFERHRTTPIDPNKPLPIIVDKKGFTATIPYTLRDYWKEGKDLKDIDNLQRKLRAAYREIADKITQKKYDWYLQKIADREYNIATAMYLTKQESEARFKRLIRDFENGYTHVEFPEDTIPVYAAYGKKVSLRRKNGDPALSFVNKEEMEQQMLDIEFYWSTGHDRLEII